MKMGKGRKKAKKVKRLDIDMDRAERIIEKARASLTAEELEILQGMLETLLFLTRELEKNGASVKRLQDMLFGAATEKTQQVLKKVLGESAPGASDEDRKATKKKAPGHGRNAAEAYTGGKKVEVPHESLKEGDACPECPKGKLYKWTPGTIVRIKGQAPLSATIYMLEKLRCNLCNEVFTASAPEGVGEEKYDASSAAMIALLKYGTGFPFNRLDKLENWLGIPLPSSTQWDIIERAYRSARPAFAELVRVAAGGDVVHLDDTTMKILKLEKQDFAEGRKGVFTTGIVSKVGKRRLALFFTGVNHAGENLTELLKQRSSELGKPIQMCDALASNMPAELQTILANCLAHGRRKFVEVAPNFPGECLHVLNFLEGVYKNDATARNEGMSPQQRLRFHKAESGPLMAELKTYMAAEIDEKRVEPNSGLGSAITYMQKHWVKLTLFLRVSGAPLDNNICERALKKAILHRKNAYFYKTKNGARVGDLFMSLIHTCELGGQNPSDYIIALLEHPKELAEHPDQWMPWNYSDTIPARATSAANRT